MTREEKERLLAEIEKQYKWLMTKSPTIYMMDIAFDAIRKAVRDEADQEPKISLDTYKQVTKERDIAIEQLHELGYEFGEKIDPTTNNCESCRYYGSHHEVCNYCYNFSLWTEQEPTTKNDLLADVVEIEEQEPQEVKPVIHAKWERGYSFPDGEYWKCSHCNELIKVKIPMHYCNNCGARMDKE